MIFTVAVIGATLAVAALPNALAALTGDIEQFRKAVELNLSSSGDPYQLEIDLKKLQDAVRWSAVLVFAQFLIVAILLLVAYGPALESMDELFGKLNWWHAIFYPVFHAITPLTKATKDPFDLGLAWLCTAVAFVLLYWRGWRPYRKGREAMREAVIVLEKLQGR